MSLNSSDYSPGTVVYWNSYYDGMWHFLCQYDGEDWWVIENDEDGWPAPSYRVEIPDNVVVVYVGGTGRLNAEQFNEAMYQYYKQKRYTYK